MDCAGSLDELAEFHVWQDAGGWHAYHQRKLTEEAAAGGCVEKISSPDPADLATSLVALRIVRSWYK
jgi:hypothetical protein